MIRNNKFLIAAGAAALSAGIYTSAVSAASVTANASARVIQGLTISEDNGGLNRIRRRYRCYDSWWSTQRNRRC